MCCGMLQYGAAYSSVLQCVVMCCSLLQSVAVELYVVYVHTISGGGYGQFLVGRFDIFARKIEALHSP